MGNDSKKTANAPASVGPQALMRARRPHLFSDTARSAKPILAKEVFEYHLDTLTSRKQEYEFEHFCRRLAEKEICPNLRAQTGPTGGGDSKVDTETFPVAQEVSDRWWVGEAAAGSQRWAFAFSAKKAWKAKVESDVRNIHSTERGYDRIYFFSSQFISDKKRAAAEDALSALGVPVHIVDRAWLVDKVFANNHIELAIATLQMQGGGAEVSAKPGPRDLERAAELEALDQQIADPMAYADADFQLAEDCLHAALLARGLERPRAEVEGRFSQAARIAKRLGYRQQLMRVAYNRAWTAYWWFEDYEEFSTYYSEVEGQLGDSKRASDLERLVNLWQLLSTASFQQHIAPDVAKLDERTRRLEGVIEAAIKDGSRPNNALQARSDRWLMRMTIAFQQSDTAALEAGWLELRGIIGEAARHGAFPTERLADIVREIGALVDDRAYDRAYEEVVDLVRRLRSDGEAGEAYNDRGLQKLKQTRPYEAIKWFGRAEGLLLKTPEHRGQLNIALIGASMGYEAAGLYWAARNKALVALERSLAPFNDDGEMAVAALPCAERLIWLELQLGRIPNILTAMMLATFVQRHLKLTDERIASLMEDRQTQEAILGIHLLNLGMGDLEQATRLPDALERLGLTNARLALLWALGHQKAIEEEGYFPSSTPPEEVQRFFENWHDQPAAEQIAKRPLTLAGDRVRLESVVLGAVFAVDCPNHPIGLLLGESVLGALEAFMSTSDEDDVLPYRETTLLKFISGAAERRPTTRFDLETGSFEITYAKEIDFGSGAEMVAHVNWLRDTVANIASHSFMVRDVETWMSRLAEDEDAIGRSVALGDMLTLSRNIFGEEPTFTLQSWVEAEDKVYPVRRSERWRVKAAEPEPPEEGDEPKFSDDAAPPDFMDRTTLRHNQRGVLSPIEIGLWDAAKWRGTLFAEYHDVPPILALGFRHPQYGKAILRGWRQRWGHADRNDELRVAIITGVSRRNPAHYSVMIGPNLSTRSDGRKLVALASRHQRMEPRTTENLDRFLKTFAEMGAYYLTAAEMTDDPALDPELFLLKGHLVVRPAWQIGPNDPDFQAIREGDDPIIPQGAEDVPLQRALAWDREMRARRR